MPFLIHQESKFPKKKARLTKCQEEPQRPQVDRGGRVYERGPSSASWKRPRASSRHRLLLALTP